MGGPFVDLRKFFRLQLADNWCWPIFGILRYYFSITCDSIIMYMTCVQTVPRMLSVIAMEQTANAGKGSLTRRRVDVVTVKTATMKTALDV